MFNRYYHLFRIGNSYKKLTKIPACMKLFNFCFSNLYENHKLHIFITNVRYNAYSEKEKRRSSTCSRLTEGLFDRLLGVLTPGNEFYVTRIEKLIVKKRDQDAGDRCFNINKTINPRKQKKESLGSNSFLLTFICYLNNLFRILRS